MMKTEKRPPQRPSKYIKSWQKLVCINQIEQGHVSIKEMATQMNVKPDAI